MHQKVGINVYSEIGKLKSVLLHRPGLEIEHITPSYMERLLFDDIPYLDVAVQEHDAFANVLRSNGVDVLYLTDLTKDVLNDQDIKEVFIKQFLNEAHIYGNGMRETLTSYLLDLPVTELVQTLMAGLKKSDVSNRKLKSLADYVNSDYPFAFDPMPNLYFTRDPFASIGNGITLNKMRTVTRQRETIFAEYIFNYHPCFKDIELPRWFNRYEDSCLEGGDELVLSDKVIAIGISQRTDAESIEKLARRLFERESGFKTILAFDIPKTRAFMHLDTVFTMVDYDKFTIHPGIEGPLTVYSITQDGKEIAISLEQLTLEDILKKYLELDSVTLIRCAGGDPIAAEREQWNDGSNTLAIAPKEVIVYSRNRVTNALLEEAGVKVNIIPSMELSRGRGGPRCMSMPLIREPITFK